MKNVIPIAITFMLVVMPISASADERFSLLLQSSYDADIDELRQHFSVTDATELFALASEKTAPETIRRNAVLVLDSMKEPSLLPGFIELSEILIDNAEVGRPVAAYPVFTEQYWKEVSLYSQVQQAIGDHATDEAIQFLKELFDPAYWYDEKSPDDAKHRIDDNFRTRVFTGLAQAAIKRPELFDYLEEQKSLTTGALQTNIISLLPEYKDRHYQANPQFLPQEGYYLEIPDDPNEAISRMLWRIQTYFEKKGELPETLMDLTINRGGHLAYLFGDAHSRSEDRFLKYAHKSGEKDGAYVYTYMLLSVGPNGGQDLNFDDVPLGMSNVEGKSLIDSAGDDIFEITTYIKVPHQ